MISVKQAQKWAEATPSVKIDGGWSPSTSASVKIRGKWCKAGATSTLGTLSRAIQAGTAEIQFPLGTILEIPWTDVSNSSTYTLKWRIVHYGDLVIDADGTKKQGAILQEILLLPARAMQDTDSGGTSRYYPYNYSSAPLRTYLIGDFFSGLPADESKFITPVRVYCRNEYGPYSRTTYDMVTIPAANGLQFSSFGNGSIADTSGWSWYSQQIPTRTDGTSTVRRFDMLDGSNATGIWTLSSSTETGSSNRWRALVCNSVGGLERGYSTYSYGISPVICVV